ncbi:MAG: hypothetical protein ACP5GH_07395, partial [Nitrososphaeria archaeon]
MSYSDKLRELSEFFDACETLSLTIENNIAPVDNGAEELKNYFDKYIKGQRKVLYYTSDSRRFRLLTVNAGKRIMPKPGGADIEDGFSIRVRDVPVTVNPVLEKYRGMVKVYVAVAETGARIHLYQTIAA